MLQAQMLKSDLNLKMFMNNTRLRTKACYISSKTSKRISMLIHFPLAIPSPYSIVCSPTVQDGPVHIHEVMNPILMSKGPASIISLWGLY